jgi:hypothetical protein
MSSFDIVSETDLNEVDNAINSAKREILNRYDFKGSDTQIERDDNKITIITEDEVRLRSVIDTLKTYMTRRKLDVRALELEKKETASGNKIRQFATIKNGLSQDDAKKITKMVKDSKIKVQASIQGDKVRVNGKKRDDLQAIISLAKENISEIPLQFINFRD